MAFGRKFIKKRVLFWRKCPWCDKEIADVAYQNLKLKDNLCSCQKYKLSQYELFVDGIKVKE